MKEFFGEFQKRGIKEDEIVQMSVMNTNHLLFDPIETFETTPAKDRTAVPA